MVHILNNSTIVHSDAESITSSMMTEKKDGDAKDVSAVSQIFATIEEEDEASDEARKLAGDIRTVYTQEEMDAVKRKLDRRLLPLLASVYLSQFLDKETLNYASILGLPITGQNYSLCALAFYLGFIIFELPTNWFGQKFGLAKYLGVNIVIWSAVLSLHAAATTFAPFFVLRFLLGVFECCVTPILIKLIAAFYKTDEQPTRIATFYLMNGVAQALGGIVSYGVTFYEGPDLAAWKLMYIIFGICALIVGIAVLIWLPDSPATAIFLTPRERLIAIERIRDNHTGTVTKQFKKSQAIEALVDPRTWLIILCTLLMSVPNGGFSNFSNLIIKGFGYTTRTTLLLSIPKGAIASVTTFSICYWAQKSRQRMLPILAAVIPTIFGAAMLVGFDADINRFKIGAVMGIFLTSTYGSSLAILYAWSASNVAGSSKKSMTNGLLMSMFALGNIIGTQIFPSRDAPNYLPGKVSVLILFSALVGVVLVIRWVNIRMNKNKAIALAALIQENGWSAEDVQKESDKLAFMDLTDRQNPFFVYVP